MENTMGKTLMVLVVMSFLNLSGSANAQTGISIGADFLYPTSDFGNVAGGGFGLNLGLSHPLNEQMDFIGEVGFNAYGGIKLTVGESSAEVQWYGVPVGVGVRYKAGEKVFVQAKGGIIYKTGEVKDNLGNKVEDSATGWLASPGLGVNLGKLGILAEYSLSNEKWQWFGLKAFYQFGGAN
jgi:hypothetical protein